MRRRNSSAIFFSSAYITINPPQAVNQAHQLLPSLPKNRILNDIFIPAERRYIEKRGQPPGRKGDSPLFTTMNRREQLSRKSGISLSGGFRPKCAAPFSGHSASRLAPLPASYFPPLTLPPARLCRRSTSCTSCRSRKGRGCSGPPSCHAAPAASLPLRRRRTGFL